MNTPSQRTEKHQQLVDLDEARRSLTLAQSIGEIKSVRHRAESIRAHAQRTSLGIEQQNYAAELKLQAERRAGEFLWNMKLRGGDRKSKSNGAGIRLRDLGIDKNQSARWQLEASVPESVFCEFVRREYESRREISSAGLLRIAKQIRDRPFTAPVNHSDRSHGYAVSLQSHLLPSNLSQDRQEAFEVGELSDLVSEARNHHELLSGLVRSVCQRARVHPMSTDYRAIQRYLGEVERHLIEIATGLNRLTATSLIHQRHNGWIA